MKPGSFPIEFQCHLVADASGLAFAAVPQQHVGYAVEAVNRAGPPEEVFGGYHSSFSRGCSVIDG